MPYTRHGYWYGSDDPHTPPDLVARCGGPTLCPDCALDAHRGEEGPLVQFSTGQPVGNPNVGVSYLTTAQPLVNPGLTTTTYTVTAPPVEPKPTIGRIVHYVSYGTPGGEYGHQCRAAIVTAIPEQHPEIPDAHPQISLCVLNPAGMFFNETVMFDGGDTRKTDPGLCDQATHHGGTWHWPARTQ